MLLSTLIETTSTDYNSDVNDAEWALIRDFMPRNQPNGRDMTVSMRDVVNAIFYQDRTGCQWRYLPKDFPSWSTVAGYYYRWMRDGTWERVLDTLHGLERVRQGKTPEPTAGIVDSQSVKVPPQAGEHGYNGHKCINGRKRHILVDTLGLLLVVVVTAANVDDRVGGALLANEARPKHRKLTHVWADSGYVGKKWHAWFQWFCGWSLEIVKRSDNTSDFETVPRRWVVERTFAWLDRYRRLSKDYEVLNLSSETRCRLATIRLLLRRLTAPTVDCI
jgi:putative transposase